MSPISRVHRRSITAGVSSLLGISLDVEPASPAPVAPAPAKTGAGDTGLCDKAGPEAHFGLRYRCGPFNGFFLERD